MTPTRPIRYPWPADSNFSREVIKQVQRHLRPPGILDCPTAASVTNTAGRSVLIIPPATGAELKWFQMLTDEEVQQAVDQGFLPEGTEGGIFCREQDDCEGNATVHDSPSGWGWPNEATDCQTDRENTDPPLEVFFPALRDELCGDPNSGPIDPLDCPERIPDPLADLLNEDRLVLAWWNQVNSRWEALLEEWLKPSTESFDMKNQHPSVRQARQVLFAALLTLTLAVPVSGADRKGVRSSNRSPAPAAQRSGNVGANRNVNQKFALRQATTPITIGADSLLLDAFGRQRVSMPSYVFDSQFTYNLLTLQYEPLVSGGTATITHDATNRMAVLTLTAAGAADYAILQTFDHFRYQPGRSQQVFITFNFQSASATCTKFVGYSNTPAVAQALPTGVVFQRYRPVT